MFCCSTCLILHLEHKEDLKEISEDEILKSLDLLENLANEAKVKLNDFVIKVEQFKNSKIKSSDDLNNLVK